MGGVDAVQWEGRMLSNGRGGCCPMGGVDLVPMVGVDLVQG